MDANGQHTAIFKMWALTLEAQYFQIVFEIFKISCILNHLEYLRENEFLVFPFLSQNIRA